MELCLGLGLGAQIRTRDVFVDCSNVRKAKVCGNGSRNKNRSSKSVLMITRRIWRIRALVESGAEEKAGQAKQQQQQRGFQGRSPALELDMVDDVDYKDVFDRMSAIVRLTYGIGLYGVMVLAGKGICSLTGVDSLGGFDFSTEAVLNGLGYAIPPMMSLLFIMDDEVVKWSPYARAIRDAEDEELLNFYLGMSPWQFMLIVTASSVGEELFCRVAVQGGLAHVFMSDTWQSKDVFGVAALTGIFPIFAPFAQGFAAVLTAALTGSLYYVFASPQDPTYVVAPVLHTNRGRNDMKKCFAAWYERRELKKIYSPLLESLLALYLGFEWIQTNNIVAPMITHTIYNAVVLGNGLRRIHEQRQKLRERIKTVARQKALGANVEYDK